jgi:hypothetical protein
MGLLWCCDGGGKNGGETRCVRLPHFLEPNPHPIFGGFLKGIKFVRGSNPRLSFIRPLLEGLLILDVTNALKSEALPGDESYRYSEAGLSQACTILSETNSRLNC